MIEFCASNMHHGTDRIMNIFEENDDYEVTEYGCLGNCGECYANPFALVDGAIISAETTDELHQNILKAIDQQLADKEALDKLLDDM
ncbi:YuzB family protein [Paenibacillus sinopodophylli]|uniref:YuzB family protein n=1 Tax=Paenibacillus sinopodophylli TaxID=1837342 RepID=UPI00110D06A3|nr:YuzB family protein [Paenibacillus sinopodophylli]